MNPRTLFEIDMQSLRMAVANVLEGAHLATDEERREIGRLAEVLSYESERKDAA